MSDTVKLLVWYINIVMLLIRVSSISSVGKPSNYEQNCLYFAAGIYVCIVRRAAYYRRSR